MIRVYGTECGRAPHPPPRRTPRPASRARAAPRTPHPAARTPSSTLVTMRYLRMLSNSLVAGALGAAYLTILLLQLNPQVPLASSTVWRWYATLGAFYGTQLAVVFYVVM